MLNGNYTPNETPLLKLVFTAVFASAALTKVARSAGAINVVRLFFINLGK